MHILDRLKRRVDHPLDPHDRYNHWSWSGKFNVVRGVAYPFLGNRSATRLLYEALIESLPSVYRLKNQCGEKSCVNPNHWRPAKHAEEMVEVIMSLDGWRSMPIDELADILMEDVEDIAPYLETARRKRT